MSIPAPAHSQPDGACLVGTLFIQRPGARLSVRNGLFSISIDGREVLHPPRHEVRRIVLLTDTQVTGAAFRLAGELGVQITWVAGGGDVLGQYQPYRQHTGTAGHRALAARGFQWECQVDPEGRLARHFAAQFLLGKLENTRLILQRTARREQTPENERRELATAVSIITGQIDALHRAESLDALRGHEGIAARAFFGHLPLLLVPTIRHQFPFHRRTRRPPRDPLNALLSFLYALLTTECVAAVTAAGLETQLGFLHTPRDGRPALALDLMEELRPAMVDRFALALVNRRQITPDHFQTRGENQQPDPWEQQQGEGEEQEAIAHGEMTNGDAPPTPPHQGPPTFLNEEGRRTVLRLWRQRLADTVSHPDSNTPLPWRLVPHLQAARLAESMARQEVAHYHPFRTDR